MRPIKRTITGAASLVIPLNHYGEPNISYWADVAVVVEPLADKDDVTTVVETKGSATSGTVLYACNALLVTTTATTDVIVNQFGD